MISPASRISPVVAQVTFPSAAAKPAAAAGQSAVPSISTAGMSRATLDSMLALSLLQLGGGNEPGATAASDVIAEIAATAASIAHSAKAAGITLERDEAVLAAYLEAKDPEDVASAAKEMYAVASKDGEQIFGVFAGGAVVMRDEYAWLGFAAGLAEDADVGGNPPLAERRLEKLMAVLSDALRKSPDGLRGLATYNVHPITLERYEYRSQS